MPNNVNLSNVSYDALSMLSNRSGLSMLELIPQTNNRNHAFEYIIRNKANATSTEFILDILKTQDANLIGALACYLPTNHSGKDMVVDGLISCDDSYSKLVALSIIAEMGIGDEDEKIYFELTKLKEQAELTSGFSSNKKLVQQRVA